MFRLRCHRVIYSHGPHAANSSSRSGTGIAIDLEGNAYITGHATASDFPTSLGSFQPAYIHGFEAFVAKLNSEGSALAYATYLGGQGADFGTAIAVDLGGGAYVTGRTASEDFPTTVGAFSASKRRSWSAPSENGRGTRRP